MQLAGGAMEAQGGAVRSKRHWYELKFNCTVAPDLKTVVAFEFLLGKEIPRDQWASHDLTLDDGPADCTNGTDCLTYVETRHQALETLD